MNRLLEIGFQTAGHWQLVDGELSLDLLRHGSQKNVLYAFVSDGDVKYVGKTVQRLATRLAAYRNPGATQTTNIKNNALIVDRLKSGAAVDVLTLPDNGLLHYGQFHVNLAAGLEDSIIAVLDPEWNGRGSKPTNSQFVEVPEIYDQKTLASFSVVLHKTYFNSGFFNVSVDHEQAFGADGEQINIFCSGAATPLVGSINRRCNSTNAPRIMGGTGLRDWMQSNAAMMDEIRVSVLTPNEIRVDKMGQNQ